MSDRWSRFDGVTNAILVACCLVVAGLALERRFGGDLGGQPPPLYEPGDTADVFDEIAYGDSDRTALLYVRSTCSYCTDSMPFYQTVTTARTTARAHSSASVSLVAVSMEPAEVTRNYLAEHGVEVDRIVSEDVRSVPTPTLVIVDSEGVVEQSWTGLLRPDAEDEVILALFPQLELTRMW